MVRGEGRGKGEVTEERERETTEMDEEEEFMRGGRKMNRNGRLLSHK